jgi:hypothetical protein
MKRTLAVGTLLVAVALLAAACSKGNVFSLDVGDCFDDPEATGEVSDVPIVTCADPHDNEVYAVIESPDGERPALETLYEQCVDRFEEFVGVPYEVSEVYVDALFPSTESWDEGDRETICYLYVPDEQVTGSLRDSNR